MTQIVVDVPAECWPGIMAEVAAAVGRQAAAVSKDVHGVICGRRCCCSCT